MSGKEYRKGNSVNWFFISFNYIEMCAPFTVIKDRSPVFNNRASARIKAYFPRRRRMRSGFPVSGAFNSDLLSCIEPE